MLLVYVIPCSADKAEQPAPARELYQGTMFKHTLVAALANAATDRAELGVQVEVLILSAKHGLVDLDQHLAPYECRMGDADAITAEQLAAQAQARGIDWDTAEVWCLLPREYLRRLDAALRTLDVYPHDVYEANQGIGEQRGINRRIAA